jgi:hypothetical protein
MARKAICNVNISAGGSNEMSSIFNNKHQLAAASWRKYGVSSKSVIWRSSSANGYWLAAKGG